MSYLSNLCNVLSVVSDKKIPKLAGSSLEYFNPDIKAYNDYYPFGSLLPGRHANTLDYRYGFQGQEMDDEIKGEGNSVNYKYRMHDPRVGRFFAVDPLFREYPYNSPYSFSENDVIRAVELEGLEKDLLFYMDPALSNYRDTRTPSQLKKDKEVFDEGKKQGMIVGSIVIGIAADYYFTKGQVSRLLGIGGLGYSMGDLSLAMKKSEGARRAEGAGDFQRAETLRNEVGDLSKGAIYEGLGAGVALGIGKIIRIATRYNAVGSKLVSTEMLKPHVRSDFYGPPSGTFMAPAKEIDELLAKGLTRNEIATKLSINDPRFLEGDLIRIDVENSLSKELNIRNPTGREQGANENFISGGKTGGGVTEVIVDQIPKSDKRVRVTKIID